jgi:hypothetical protein
MLWNISGCRRDVGRLRTCQRVRAYDPSVRDYRACRRGAVSVVRLPLAAAWAILAEARGALGVDALGLCRHALGARTRTVGPSLVGSAADDDPPRALKVLGLDRHCHLAASGGEADGRAPRLLGEGMQGRVGWEQQE